MRDWLSGSGGRGPLPIIRPIQPAVSSRRSLIRDLVQVFLLASIFYLAATSLVETVHVVGWSMYPTLESGDMLIASKIDYRLHPPDRGDIIILKAPLDPSRDYVKRIIGLPGDHILIRDSRVYVNGDPLAEPYLGNWQSTGNWPNPALRSEGERVPVNSYFVLGDNRDRSNDSRVFGYVRQDQIDGKVFVRFWPLGHAELITLKPTVGKT